MCKITNINIINNTSKYMLHVHLQLSFTREEVDLLSYESITIYNCREKVLRTYIRVVCGHCHRAYVLLAA